MTDFIEIKPEEFIQSPFQLIGTDWMLITAEKDGRANTMTASWGGLGVMWGKNVAFIVIRPQRYTKEFVENTDTFSLTFLDKTYKKQLNYCGSVSGRDENKIKNCGFTILHLDSTPYFQEGKFALICKKLYAQNYLPECFIAKDLNEKWYDNDHHTLYIAEVNKILAKAQLK